MRAALAIALTIFHGHHHATDHYTWHGFDVFKPGAVKDGAHTFAVVHVTDERITVASFDWDHDTWAAPFEKRMPLIEGRALPASRSRHESKGKQGDSRGRCSRSVRRERPSAR